MNEQRNACILIAVVMLAIGCRDSSDSKVSKRSSPSPYEQLAGEWEADGASGQLIIDRAGFVSIGDDDNDMLSSAHPCEVDSTGNSFEVEVRIPVPTEKGGGMVSVRLRGRVATDDLLIVEMANLDGTSPKSTKFRRSTK